MKGYTYTITPDNKPLYILYSWQVDAEGSPGVAHYTVDNFVPELDKENNGYSAVVAHYPAIGLYVPLLKVQGFLVDAYLASGYLKKEDVVYVPFSSQLLDYIKTTIKPVSEANKGLAVEVGELYRNYEDALGNRYMDQPAAAVQGGVDQGKPVLSEDSREQVPDYGVEPEAFEFGGGYEVRFTDRSSGEAYHGADVHPEDNLTGATHQQATAVYDNFDRNKPMGTIPLEYPEDTDSGLVEKTPNHIGGQIPMVYPPTGKGKVQASVQVADVCSLIPINMPV